MSEYTHEPVRGLPGNLPDDEHMLWQSSPDWKYLAGAALHIRITAVYFALIAIWAVLRGDMNTALAVLLFGAVVVGMFTFYAWGVTRTTVYTLTDKRLVLRIGVALSKCVNIPLSEIDSASLKTIGNGHGNIVLMLKGAPRLGYLMLWPHARSLRFVRPQPVLRAIPDAQNVAAMLFKATQQVQAITPPDTQVERSHDRPLMGAVA